MKATHATFIGGPWDLHRVAIEEVQLGVPVYKVACASRVTTNWGIEGRPYAELGYYEAVYQRQSCRDRDGNEIVVYVFSYDTDKTPSELRRLREENDRLNRTIKDAQYTLASAR